MIPEKTNWKPVAVSFTAVGLKDSISVLLHMDKTKYPQDTLDVDLTNLKWTLKKKILASHFGFEIVKSDGTIYGYRIIASTDNPFLFTNDKETSNRVMSAISYYTSYSAEIHHYYRKDKENVLSDEEINQKGYLLLNFLIRFNAAMIVNNSIYNSVFTQ